MGVSRNKSTGAQRHMMVNMCVKFFDCGCYTFDTIFRRMDGWTEGRTFPE